MTQVAPPITAVTPAPPPEQYVIEPPPPPVVGAARAAEARGPPRHRARSPATILSYPREAIRAGVSEGPRGRAAVRSTRRARSPTSTSSSSEPRGVFDKVVRAALETWKFKAEGEKYVGEVEINFTLKDE